MVATASESGTIIKVFGTDHGQKLFEFRRGTSAALVYSIAFSHDDKYLAVTSDHNTLHVWTMNREAEDSTAKNKKPMLGIMKSISPYFDSQYSFAQWRLPNKDAVQSKVAFVRGKNMINVVTIDG
jgi:WD40 repeat protein